MDEVGIREENDDPFVIVIAITGEFKMVKSQLQRFAFEKLQGETWVEQQPEAWNATKLLQLIIPDVLAQVVHIPGRYIDLNEHVEAVWTNRNDNQIGARIWMCARVVAACNRKLSGG